MADVKIDTGDDGKERQASGEKEKVKATVGEDLHRSADTGKSEEIKKKMAFRKGKGKELEELRKRVENLEKERAELREHNLRVHAETENFKKRMIREKEDFIKYSNEKIVRELLPVVDNLERAIDHAKEAGETGTLLEGVEMTLGLFRQTLEKLGVAPISSIGETFNPERHEAVQQIESADHEPNIVVSEFQKGYMLNARLIRPAMVVVSRSPEKNKNQS